SKIALRALDPYRAQSYGKGGIVGLAGEQEHINALLTTMFANPLRKAVGGGKAWISSMTKRGGPGTPIDIPLASKDALYVRSHYDCMTITLHDAPLPDELAVIISLPTPRCTTRSAITHPVRRRLDFSKATRTAVSRAPSLPRKSMCPADPQIRKA